MSAPIRELPPPAAIAIPPQQASNTGVTHSQHHESQQPPPPPRPPAGQDGPKWHRSEESMRSWLQAKAEEEKTKQEEQKTRQESLRLEQRRVESELLQYSLRGGIPPPMIPLLFAGKTTGWALPQAAVDLAHQFLLLSPTQQLQHSSAQRQHSPDSHQREGDTQNPSPEDTAKLAPLPGRHWWLRPLSSIALGTSWTNDERSGRTYQHVQRRGKYVSVWSIWR
ncbi:hypothetical protein VB005_02404 [Metarhizium brunneum]